MRAPDLTTDEILAALDIPGVSFRDCWDALGPPTPERETARRKIWQAIETAGRAP